MFAPIHSCGCAVRFGGVGTFRAATRIQKVWRGYQGRCRAIEIYQQFLNVQAQIMIGFAYIIKVTLFNSVFASHSITSMWVKAKKECRRRRTLQWDVAAEKIQAVWKGRLSRQLYHILRHRHRSKMALRIQMFIRRQHARHLTKLIRECGVKWQHEIEQHIGAASVRAAESYTDSSTPQVY